MSAAAQINWDDDAAAKNAPQIKWDETPAATSTPATTAAKPPEPSTWEKLTRGVNPSLDEFSAKHTVAGPIVRGLDAAGGALIGTIPSIASSVLHPIDTANAVGQSIEDWTTHPKEMARGIPSVLPELVGQNVGGAAAIGGVGEAASRIPKITATGTATRVLRGPGGYGDIQSPAGHFPGLIRELESRVPRNEPPTARTEMYDDLASRRAARGEEQAKLDAQHEANLRETEQARQKELADAERLREQHARSLAGREEPPQPPDPLIQAVREGRAARIPTRMPEIAPPEPELGSPENPAWHSKLPDRIPPIKTSRGITFDVPIPERQAAIPNIAANPAADLAARQATARASAPVTMEAIRGGQAVRTLPEPRTPFEGENPKYMASVPRKNLRSLAAGGKPGAGTQLQQLGEKVIYAPTAGFPAPREVIRNIGEEPEPKTIPELKRTRRLEHAAD